jgi:hypothetical protein
VLLAGDPGSISFILTAIALAIVIVGVLVVSSVWKTPTYNLILAWIAGNDMERIRPALGRVDLPLSGLTHSAPRSTRERTRSSGW